MIYSYSAILDITKCEVCDLCYGNLLAINALQQLRMVDLPDVYAYR
jgi:hypothetical protein